jgi:hypothetical protein
MLLGRNNRERRQGNGRKTELGVKREEFSENMVFGQDQKVRRNHV